MSGRLGDDGMNFAAQVGDAAPTGQGAGRAWLAQRSQLIQPWLDRGSAEGSGLLEAFSLLPLKRP